MKRSAVAGARDSPTKERYTGKRQQHSGRGGRRQKPGSRDVSPAPPSWPLQPGTAVAPTLPPPAPPPVTLTPHQIALQQQHLAETAAKTPVSELILQINRLTFPSSYTFVLNLLERYVKASLTNDTLLKLSLPKKGPLLTLLQYFILCQPVSVKVAGKKAKVEQRPVPYTPLEELQVMMSLVKLIEEHNNSTEQQFYMFEALFGGCIGTIKTGPRAGETFFERVVCLAVSLQCSPVLSCIALWMQVHPSEALSLSHSLYSCFCEHLPDASEPLMQLASQCPQLAQQLAISYATLYPFHIVGAPVPGMDSAHLQPPEKLLGIVSNWIENTPRFLYVARLLDKTDLLPFHAASKAPQPPPASSPLAGLMQWCVLAPCHHLKHSPGGLNQVSTMRAAENGSKLLSEVPKSVVPSPTKESVGDAKEDERNGSKGLGDRVLNIQSLIAKLHANLLSVILSDSQLFPHDTLTSDHVAMTVAALLRLSNHQPLVAQIKKKAGKAVPPEENDRGEDEENPELNESVERLAQFLQISLSTGLLALSAENLSSMASTLPTNKLLSLVIAHHSTRR